MLRVCYYTGTAIKFLVSCVEVVSQLHFKMKTGPSCFWIIGQITLAVVCMDNDGLGIFRMHSRNVFTKT